MDVGGVSRDMFSAFWEDMYLKMFDGGSILAPIVHPGTNMSIYPLLGTVLSHGFMSCGFMPIRIAFPVLARVLYGPSVDILEHILVDCFADYLSTYENAAVSKALSLTKTAPSLPFPSELSSTLVDILSRMGCHGLPNPNTLRQLILETARYEFLIKPLGALCSLQSGVPDIHRGFWDTFSIDELYKLKKIIVCNSSACAHFAHRA